jgi:endonuclease/exonuclease/phosphatase family metal-dependent hydrolase
MPFYFPLRWNFSPEEGQRTAANLLNLRRQIRKEIPYRTVNDTLLMATWNIRDFDSNKFRHGPRLKESFFYIAEIISAFDIVAVQEVNADLSALKTVMQILGPNWDYITTDKTDGKSGNQERMAFVYDTRKVDFQKIAGEIVLPQSKLVGDDRQFARTPFLVSFQSGWFRFMICTVHLYYGSSTGEKLQRRVDEIDAIAGFLAKRAEDESANYIVLGDFNIVSPEHKTMDALTRHGFVVPDELAQAPSNMLLNKHYDQIGFKARDGQVKFGGHSGVFNFYETLFREEDVDIYRDRMTNEAKLDLGEDGLPTDSEENTKYYLSYWRTFQMSDHLPMWVELKIDFAEEYLQKLRMASFAMDSVHPLSFEMPQLDD